MRAGDDDAFGVLFGRYRQRVAGLAASMVGDHARAEDLTQEVFISALGRMRATQAPITFKPWIYEIARNACIDSFRRSRRAEVVSLDVEDGMATRDVARLAAGDPSPAAALDDKQRLADLRGALGGLSAAEHGALIMRELEGRSYREIGQRLEMGRPAVESTLFRARRKLEAEYEELRSGERCRRVQALVAVAAGDGPDPGLRDSRRLARHISHCQPCRRAALAAGVAVAPARRTVRSRVAELLPLPGFLRPEGGAMAHLMGFAEPAAAWTKALAAAATVTVAGLGAGVAVEQGAGVKLGGAAGGRELVERLQGAGGTQEARTAAAVASGTRSVSGRERGAGPGGEDGGAGERARQDGDSSGSRAPKEPQQGRAPRDEDSAPRSAARREKPARPAPAGRRPAALATPGGGGLPGAGVDPSGGVDPPAGGPEAEVPSPEAEVPSPEAKVPSPEAEVPSPEKLPRPADRPSGPRAPALSDTPPALASAPSRPDPSMGG